MKGAGEIGRNRDDGGFERRYEIPGLRANGAKLTPRDGATGMAMRVDRYR
jgi:hypothetical protein